MSSGPSRGKHWGPDDRTGGPLDAVFDELRQRISGLVVERLVVHRDTDDDNVFFVGDETAGLDRIQVDTAPGGGPPFVIEDGERIETSEANQAVGIIFAKLTSGLQ